MQTRYRAAATALLLTASAGLAASGGAAEASGTHHTSARATHSLTITVKTKAGSVVLSDARFRPGNTVFKVKNAGGRGLIQVLRLKPGYTLNDAFTDFALAFPSDESTPPDLAAVRRIDRNVVFYGGVETPRKSSRPANKWAVNINKAGTYYVVNLDANNLTSFKAKGDKQKRSLPAKTGWINAAPGPNGTGNVFKAGKHNAARGWMSTTNSAHEPHFVDLEQVKKGTTDADVTAMFAGTGPPVFVPHGGAVDTGVISPGHTFLWTYGVPKGRYVAMCFWPSKTNGMPHALMGMHKVMNLH
jgi:hypothetical protein